MNDFYTELSKIKTDPEHWYIYSGNAYEICQQYTEDKHPYLTAIVDTLLEVRITMGWQGFDQWDRYIYNDYYGTAYYPTGKSIEFIRSKKAQQHRIEQKILAQLKETRQRYDHYDTICKTSHNPKISREKRNQCYERLSDLSRRSNRAFNALTRYRGCFEVEFYQIEKG